MKNTLIKLGLVLKKEIVFTAALLLAVLSSFFVPVSKEYLGYLDYRVLALLFWWQDSGNRAFSVIWTGF